MGLEQDLKELEALAEKLEKGNLSLDEGIALYQQGISLTKDCLNSLNESKDKIALIKEEMNKLIEKPIDEE